MKFAILGCALLLFAGASGAQQNAPPRKSRPSQRIVVQSPPTVFKLVEQNAKFNGDVAAYVNSKLRYPADALENGIEGRSLILFEVGTEGYVRVLSVRKSSGNPELDAEAKRVIGNMPKWIPAKRNGVARRSVMLMPVFFKIDRH